MTPRRRRSARPPAAHYAFVPRPWRARVDTRSRRPARHLAALIGQTLRYGMPARRRLGAAWAVAGRRGIPERLVAGSVARFPRAPDPRLDGLLESLRADWARLRERSERLPPSPGALTGLALERSAALTVFVFASAPEPLLVAKIPARATGGLEAELAALRAIDGTGIAPRDLGEVGGAFVQEGLAGAPLRVEPLTPARSARIEWTREHQQLARALTRLAEATASKSTPPTLAARVESALGYHDLAHHARRSLAAAWRDVRPLEASVVRHCDASPQNCLYVERRLCGIVDWELAEVHGAPGFDVWNAAVAYVEHGLGLVRWSQERAVEALARSWPDAPFWVQARAAARDAAMAAGVPERRLDALELVFFASRIGDRLLMPEVRRGTETAASARMCELVAAS
jgi:hypothetical protein